ncbi:hypothetical protein BDV12DRAFT_200431 [Aspergillus spectabilis]
MDPLNPPSPEYLAESQVTGLYIGFAIPIPLAIFMTGLRLWAEFQPGRHGLAFDDYLMTFGTLATIGLCVTGIAIGPPAGLGRHLAALSSEHLQRYVKLNLALSHLYNFASASTKLSVIALYFRVLPKHTFQSVLLLTAGITLMWLLALEMVDLVVCPDQNVDQAGELRQCMNISAFTGFVSISNLLLDLWIFLLPLPITLRLKVSRKKKIGISVMFSLGLAVCGVCAAKVWVYYSGGVEDLTWTSAKLYMFSTWEAFGTILCSNIPVTYKPLVVFFRKVTGLPPAAPDRSRSHSHRSWYQLTIGRVRKNNTHLQISSYNDTLGTSTLDLELMGTNRTRDGRDDEDEEVICPDNAILQTDGFSWSDREP